MNNFLDDHPQDWMNNPEYQELQRLLVVCAVDSGGLPFLQDIATEAGIAPGKFPERPNVDDTCNALIKEMGLEGKLRQLVKIAATRPTVHQQRFNEMLMLPAKSQMILNQQILLDGILILDRIALREKLALLESDTNLAKVLLVRGSPQSGKSHGHFLFENLAQHRGAQCVYLCDGIVATVDEVITQLFSALDASKEIPPRNTTADAWYKAVCVKLQEVASSKGQPLWITIDDLGPGQDGGPLLDPEIRRFCEQFALNMMNPAFRKWFRLMLIHYPDGPVPTKWKHEFWEEDRTNSADIQQNHIEEFLKLWRAAQNRTILDDELKQLATSVIAQADAPPAPDMPRLQLIYDGLTKVIQDLSR